MADENQSRGRGVPRFALGSVVGTLGAVALMENAGIRAATLLARHVRGDWGELCDEDCQTNEDALIHGWRVMSVYRLSLKGSDGRPITDADTRIWIITEADRSVTTLLLPDEY